jgi:hypothetical protein
MAYRQIKSTFSLASTNQPQPMIGSWITAGAGITAPAGAPITLTLGTATTSGNDATNIFVNGETAMLVDPNGAHMESVHIASVTGNTVTLGASTDTTAQGGANPVTRYAHVAGVVGTGTWIMPNMMANNFLLTFEDGGTGTFMYVGCSWAMTATAYRIFKMAKTASGVQPQYYSSAMFSPGNAFTLSEIFVFGTAADVYNVSIAID